MASKTKTIYAPASNKYGYTLGVSYTETTVETLTPSNKTRIKPKATISGKDINFSGGNNTLAIYWVDNNKHKNGTLVATKTITSTTRGVTYTAEGTIDVEHNADGTLKGKARAVWTKVGTSSYIPPTTTLETDETSLVTLPRATKLENKSATIGQLINIIWTKASPSFTHTLTYEFEGQTGVIGENLVDGVDWTPPTELYEFLTGSSGEGTLTLTTYDGETQIGDAQTSTLTLNVDKEATKPNLDEYTIKDVNETTKTLTGNENTIVAHKSIVNINLWIYTKEYAKAKKIIVNNTEVTIPSGVVQSDGKTTLYLVEYDAGNVINDTFNVSITDTREVSYTQEIKANSFVEYVPLDISSSFKRIAPTTGEVGVEFSGNYFNDSFGSQSNSLSIGFKYKKKSEDAYSNIIMLQENVDYKIVDNTYNSGSGDYKTTIALKAVFDYRFVYEVQFIVSDKATTLPIINVVITKGIPIFWWNGEKVVVNGELYVANNDGENASIVPKVVQEYLDSDGATYSCNYINQQLENVDEKIDEETKEVYSTDEQVIGTWINGKPLYRKTIDFGTLPNKATKTVAHNVANISSVVKIYGYSTNYTNYIPLPYAHSDTLGLSVMLYATKTQVGVQTGADRTSYATTIIIIEYVKSTD